jgi:hypothetical protein
MSDDQGDRGGANNPNSANYQAPVNPSTLPPEVQFQLLNGGATPQQVQASNSLSEGGGFLNYLDQAMTAVSIGAASAGLGTAIGGLGGAIAGGAVGGAGNAVASDVANDAPITAKGVGKGALVGGASGGLGYAASPVTGALTNAGLPAPVSSALVKGAIGTGVGALGATLNGGNVGNAALTGGIGGAASGAVGNLTGSSAIGQASGTIAGALAGKYLTSPTTPVAPSAPAAASTPAAAPAKSTITQSAPVAAAPTSVAATPVASTAAPTNIGPYNNFSSAGLGYQPRVQTNYANTTNFNNYGQGPEQSFFQPVPGT